jgi:hypothetical protein
LPLRRYYGELFCLAFVPIALGSEGPETLGMCANDRDLVGPVRDTIVFLRRVALDLHHLAGRTPGMDGPQLRLIADQCARDADQLSSKIGAEFPYGGTQAKPAGVPG